METTIAAISNALSSTGEKMPVPVMRDKIMALEKAIQAHPDAKTAKDFETNHHFSTGVYMRELVIPADTVLTGRIHKTAHLNILSKGKITVWTEDGMKTLSAPQVIKSERGMKRVGYTHQDSIWITVHSNPSDEREIEKVEARLFTDSFEDLYLDSNKTIEDVCVALGITPSEMQAISENELDQISHPLASIGETNIAASPIHGKGVFAAKRFDCGDVIALARLGGKRTPVGRYCNHSGQPNAKMVMGIRGDVDLVAIAPIEPGEEITVDYFFAFNNTRPIAAITEDKLCQL